MLTSEQIRSQSQGTYNQWKEIWREHATQNGKNHKMHSMADFEGSGYGKAILAIGNGFSFQDNIETIKKYQDQVDILCCDKTLGHCLDNGIKPTFVIAMDAKISYDAYLKKWKDQVSDIITFGNVCANPEWFTKGNWKKVYFTCQKDILNSQIEFQTLSGCPNVIPAGTNVSNAMIVLLTQSDEKGKRNFFGYDKILLIGYDYSWQSNRYYAFDNTGAGKDNYMRHDLMRSLNGKLVYTSNNLNFSAQWLLQYAGVYKIPLVQCSNDSIFALKYKGNLEEQMQYKPIRSKEGRAELLSNYDELKGIDKRIFELKDSIKKLSVEQYYNVARSV